MLQRNYADLLLIWEEGIRHYVPIEDFNTFIYNHILHRKKSFLSLLFARFQLEEILKRYIKDCFKINCKKGL